MSNIKYLTLFLLLHINVQSQVVKDTLKNDVDFIQDDTIISKTILIEEVIVSNKKLDAESKKQFLILQNRVYKVYPYAKIAADRLTALNANMNKLKSEKEKKKYFKIVEQYLDSEFKNQLKKLSRKQGQILVKLIHRQTGFTTYDLIKDYKSGWKAFWSNNTAKLFDINLKTPYNPEQVNEDFLIETILFRAFSRGRLVEQKAANPVDLTEISELWEKRAMELNKK